MHPLQIRQQAMRPCKEYNKGDFNTFLGSAVITVIHASIADKTTSHAALQRI